MRLVVAIDAEGAHLEVDGKRVDGVESVKFVADTVDIPDCDNPEWVTREVSARWVDIRLPFSAVDVVKV